MKKIIIFLVLLASREITSQQDFLSDYLNGKVFGANPGPCPTESLACKGSLDLSSAPSDVQNIPITILDGYCFGVRIFGECVGYDGGFTRPLAGPSGWFQGGNLNLWELRCTKIGVNNLVLRVQGTPSSNVVNTDLNPQNQNSRNLVQNCNGKVRLTQVKMRYSGAPVVGTIQFELNGRTDFESGRDVSIDFGMRVVWYADPVNSAIKFTQTLPRYVRIPSEYCSLGQNSRLGLRLVNQNWGPTSFTIIGITFTFNSNQVTSFFAEFFLAAIDASLKVTICNLLQYSAVTEANTDGPLNRKLKEYYNYFYNELTNGRPDDVGFLDRNLVLLTNNGPIYPVPFEKKQRGFPVTASQLEKSINFNDSRVVELASLGVNDWLNQPIAGRIEYPLAVNEVVERLLGTEVNGVVEPNVFGQASFDLVKEGYFLSTLLSFKWARLNISLERVDFERLNTITDFGLIENNYCANKSLCDASTRMNYTLNNTIQFGELKLGIKMRMRLLNDEWVTFSSQCRPNPYPWCLADSTEYVFYLNTTLINARLEASTTAAFNPYLLDDLQVGQFTGIDFGGDIIDASRQIANCLAPGLYTGNIPNLNFSTNNLADFTTTFQNGNNGMAAFVSSSVRAMNILVGSAFKSELPEFVQGPSVRGELNAFLWDSVDRKNIKKCAPYIPPISNEALDFEYGVVSYLYPVINKILGGSYITTRKTETDINDLIQIILEYYSEEFDDFVLEPHPLPPNQIQGQWRTKDEFQSYATFDAYQDFGVQENNFINFGNFAINNLNQIEEFLVRVYGETRNGFQMRFNISNTTVDGDGDPSKTIGPNGMINNPNPLQLAFDFNVKAYDNYDSFTNKALKSPINDAITVTLVLKDMDMWIAFDQIVVRINQINKLKLRQIRSSIPCVLSALESYEVAGSSLNAENLFLDLSVSQYEAGVGAPLPGQSRFGQAVANLSLTLQPPSFPSLGYKTMINTILNNGLRQALVTLKEQRYES